MQRIGEPLQDQKVLKYRKINKNWMNWLINGYVIYASVVLQMYPNKEVALLRFQEL